ncbi:MAG: sigma-70 family RNA polymerase sigma factor [Spirochaetales bacterium]
MGSDYELIQKILQGNPTLYGVLVKKYQKQIYALGVKLFRNLEDAEDFSQEVFIKAYERLHSFRGDSAFYTWLFRVGYFLGLSWHRKRKGPVSLPSEYDIPDSTPAPEIIHLQKDALAALQSAIDELPDRYRICLELYFSFGMTYQDISDITDIPVGTVKSHVFRAKLRLRESLKGTVAEAMHEV